MKFRDLPLGAVFRFSAAGLPPRLATREALGPFRKVADDGAADLADPREVKLYVPPATNVVEVPPAQKGQTSSPRRPIGT